jgi:flagellar basal body-associated protein FliL
MDLKKMKKDRSGLATIIIVVIIVIILVVAAGAAFFLLSGNGNNDKKEEMEMAPGTSMDFDMSIDDTPMGSVGFILLGQNKDEYFVKLTITFDFGMLGKIEMSEFMLSPKDEMSPVVDPEFDLKKVETI